MTLSRLRYITLALFVLALTLRGLWGLPRLAQDYLLVSEGDYTLYQVGAAHILETGRFDNSIFLVRPPLFPLLVAAFNDNQTLILLANILFGALIVPLTVSLTRRAGLPDTVALLAGLLVAVDPFHIRFTAYLGPEALSFVAALAALACLMSILNAQTNRAALGWGIGAGVALLVSAYARPSIYLLWTGFSVWLLVLRPRRWLAVAAFAFISFAGIQAWALHNGAVFGNPTFSTIGAYTRLYYRAVSVLNQANPDMTLDAVYMEVGRRVEAELGRDPDALTDDPITGYLAASPEVEQAMQTVSNEIFREYPGWYALTFGVGVVRYFQLLPPFPPFSNLTDPTQYPVIVYNWLVLGCAAAGLYLLARHRQWQAFWMVVLFGGYFTAGTLLTKSSGMSARERTVMFPVVAVAAAYSLSWLWLWWNQRKAAQS